MKLDAYPRVLLPTAALIAGLIAGHSQPSAAQAAGEKPRQYKVVDVDAGSPFEKILNDQAKDGWTYRGDIMDRGTTEMLVFER